MLTHGSNPKSLEFTPEELNAAVDEAHNFGLRVEVTDSYGLVEIYAHMEDTAVNVGDEVQQGQRVGSVGSTGLSVGSHLHFQLQVGGVPADPLPLVGCA